MNTKKCSKCKKPVLYPDATETDRMIDAHADDTQRPYGFCCCTGWALKKWGQANVAESQRRKNQ